MQLLSEAKEEVQVQEREEGEVSWPSEPVDAAHDLRQPQKVKSNAQVEKTRESQPQAPRQVPQAAIPVHEEEKKREAARSAEKHQG